MKKNLLLFLSLLFLPILLDAVVTSKYDKLISQLVIISSLSIPILFFPKTIKIYSFFISFPLYIIYFIHISHYIIFGSVINAESYLVIFATNMKETTEFINHFISVKIVLLIVLMVLAPIMFISLMKTTKEKNIINYLAIFLISSIILYFHYINYALNVYRIPLMGFLHEYIVYQKELYKLNKIRNNFENIEFNNIESRKKDEELYVIVIGESATRSHMQIYGYQENTTPHFEQIKDELIIFNNVISPHVNTILSLREVLTFSDSDNPQKYLNGSIINFFNSAGYKTYWISNQFSLGINDNMVTAYAKDASENAFLNNKDWRKFLEKTEYDEVLLPEIQKAISDTSNKKIIFIHLQGSHSMYSNRYPENFNIFGNKPSSAYDNSILYTDYILSQILDMLKTSKVKEKYLIYFSDHGEDVSEEEDSCFCHNESNPTPMMYEVPLVMWFSEAYRNNNSELIDKLKKNVNINYNLNQLIHSIIILSGLNHEKVDINKSLIK